MAFIHLARREVHCKVVYYGPGRGGKTTNLIQLHRSLPGERRGGLTTLKTAADRTLYFDFMPLDLGRIGGFQTRIHLYTVPGQPRYNASRRLVLQGVDGVVFVADSRTRRLFANRQSFANLRENLARVGRPLSALPLVLQYNKRDLERIAEREQLDRLLNADRRPVVCATAVRGEGVEATLRAILQLVLAELGRGSRSRR